MRAELPFGEASLLPNVNDNGVIDFTITYSTLRTSAVVKGWELRFSWRIASTGRYALGVLAALPVPEARRAASRGNKWGGEWGALLHSAAPDRCQGRGHAAGTPRAWPAGAGPGPGLDSLGLAGARPARPAGRTAGPTPGYAGPCGHSAPPYPARPASCLQPCCSIGPRQARRAQPAVLLPTRAL